MPDVNKQAVWRACLDQVKGQVEELLAANQKVKESIDGEQKSSAGDKFETSRAMAHKEMELLAVQLNKALNDLGILEQISPTSSSEHVQLGSLVQTKNKLLYIAVAIGRIQLEGKDVFVISPSSPIGQQLIGQSVGFKYTMGPNEDQIKRID